VLTKFEKQKKALVNSDTNEIDQLRYCPYF